MRHILNRICMNLRAVPMLCALGLGLTAPLAGCAKKTVAVSVTGYNHMKDWSIAGFSVNGGSGPNISPEGGGGKESCCVSIPEHWHSGMKATVKWAYDTKQSDPRTPPPPQEAVVDIPEYTPGNLGKVQVHFYPNHKIKVVVSRYGLGSPVYPMSPEDMLPWKVQQDLIEYYKERGWK